MPSVKNIGKPCAGKPHARFDEEGLVKLTMEWLLRHRQTKGAETDKQLLMAIESQSFTLPFREKTYRSFFIKITDSPHFKLQLDYLICVCFAYRRKRQLQAPVQ